MKNKSYFTMVFVFISFFLLSSVGVVIAGTCELPIFDYSNFGLREDNPFFSTGNLGYTYIYEAETEDGLVRDFQYFNLSPSKTISGLGVTVYEVYDVEYLFLEDYGEWVKLEETWDWHDWDSSGNFWYFGEDTRAYEWNDNYTCYTISTEGAWEADGGEVKPGIILLADPKPGNCVLQEFFEGEAEDRGRVLRLNGNASDDCDKDCLVTKEWTKLDPGNVEHKYYAPNIGLVYIEELKEKTVIFELVDMQPGAPDFSEMFIRTGSECAP